MQFDALALNCLVQETAARALPGRIQKIVMPDPRSLVLELYGKRQRHWLRITGWGPECGLYLTEIRPRRGEGPNQPFLELLRKYAEGAGASALYLPDPDERVVCLALAHREHGEQTLMCELTGRNGNLFLLGEGNRILGSLRRVPPGTPRDLRPRQPYQPLPPRDMCSPLECPVPRLEAALGVQADAPGWRALTATVAGMGPMQAREIVFRTSGRTDAAAGELDAPALAGAIRDLWQPVLSGEWSPSSIGDDGGVAACAPYPIRHLPGAKPEPELTPLLSRLQPPDPYAEVRRVLRTQIGKAGTRTERRLKGAARDLPEPGVAERLRTQAQWLLALQHSIRPGQTELDLPDGSAPVALVPGKTPVQQAEAMFKRARKLERAAEAVPRRIRELERDRDYLAQLLLDLEQAADRPELEAVREDLEQTGLAGRSQVRKARPKVPRPARGPRRFRHGQFTVLVGRNARQNDQVTFAKGSPKDLWLHARDHPGSHVVIQSGGRNVPRETLEGAARLAAYHSGLRGENRARVMVAERRHVRKPARARPGQVTIRKGKARTVVVDAVEPDWQEAGAAGFSARE